MKKNYNVREALSGKVISYEQDGYLVSFTSDPSNADYQEYLASLEATEPEEE
jgi:hypothetical protein